MTSPFDTPVQEVGEIIRCKECRWIEMGNERGGFCDNLQMLVFPDFYCAYAMKAERGDYWLP